MFTKRITLIHAFGFPIRIDLSWLFIAFLVSWSLSANYFPHQLPGFSGSTYWTMGILGMLGLFLSVLLHELGHALVARRFGMKMDGITLFIFGGVAEMSSDPPSPKVEFWVAVGGPAVSLVLAIGLTAMTNLDWPDTVSEVIRYLGFINGVLLVFNMVPAFPLDGGRVLRSLLWAIWNSLRRATRIVSIIGSIFGWFLITLGMIHLLSGLLVSAIWWTLLGFFVISAANMSYQQVLIRKLLEGQTVSRFMNREPVTVGPENTLDDIVEHYIYRHGYKFYPVMEDDGGLKGAITVGKIKEIPRDRWNMTAVREVMEPVSEENTIEPGADAIAALERMNKGRLSRLLVVRDNKLEGVLTLKDMMRFLGMKIELGEAS